MKFFTPKEATNTLPLVRRIVDDILKTGQELSYLIRQMNGKVEDNPEIEELKDHLVNYMGELNDLGCQYKDWNFDVGLVDFPAIIGGKQVLLCWRSDENELRYYHYIDSGYDGRLLIPKKYFEEEEK